MQQILTYFFLLGCFLLSSFAVAQEAENFPEIHIKTKQKQFEVGSNIVLEFSNYKQTNPLLYCTSSYGATLVSATLDHTTNRYKIPANISNKIGVVHWELIDDSVSIKGQFRISPKSEVATIETYIGPPSIEAGGTDFTMLVVIPTDSLDNPVPTNTLVNAKHQFLASENSDNIFTKNLIAYKNIYSQKESGRMLIASECLTTNSKEFTVNVMAAIPTGFTITAKQSHQYADGNQVTTFVTSVLKDKQDNVVSDGTFVSFFITNKSGNILKTSGTTIDGVATSKMIHPDHEEQWSIKAYVNGMAESNTITLNYKQVIPDVEVTFSKNNRDVTIGPLQSFMKQMIPDGLRVQLFIYKNNNPIKSYTKTSRDGFVHFNVKEDIVKNDTYTIIIETAGIEKTFNSKKLW